MALNSGKILMRRGQEVNFDPNKMTPGEWAVSLDNKYVRMCFSPGVCVRMATYDAFEADMLQIQRILAECQTVEEAVQRIYEEIKDVAVDVERIETAAANALKSEQNALNSENSAIQSANTAVNKANEASESANTASTKAEQATEGARIATEKANEAANSAENVRNMSDVSQSYAVGGTGTREGEDTDNAKYYNQQASDNADRAEEAAERASVAAGFGGTYTELRNKPTINDVELVGNKTLDELGIASKEALEETDNKVNIIIENAELRFKETASGENIHLDDSTDSKLVEFAMYGKARQIQAPTINNPIPIVIAGSSGTLEVKNCGKNLLPYPYVDTTVVKNGITFTDVGDGTIIADGTATETAIFSISSRNLPDTAVLSNGSYILTGCPAGGDISTYRLGGLVIKKDGVSTEEKAILDIGSGANFSIDENWYSESYVRVYCQIQSGTKVDNIIFKPMICCVSDDSSKYEKYKETASAFSIEGGIAGIAVDINGNYTDLDGQQWICDEIVKYADGSGEYIKRLEKIVLDGSEDEGWANATASDMYRKTTSIVANSIKRNSNNNEVANILCTQFVKKSVNQTYQKNDGVSVGTNGNLYFYSSEYNTNNLSAWTTHLSENPMEILFELANPIRTPLTTEELAEIEKLKTFYPVTNISNDGGCGMKVKYIVDSKNYIDNQLAIQAKLQEEALLNMLLLMPEEVQASMIENDTNNLLNESEV